MPEGGAYFTLETATDWTLELRGADQIASGTASTVSLFLDDLEPSQDYVLRTPLGALEFQTKACAGLVDAAAYGVSEGNPNNAAAFAKAIAAVPKGGTLRVGAGRFLTGPIFLKPVMTLLLEDGCEIAGIAERDDWPQLPDHDAKGRVMATWEGLPERCFASLVTAIDCHGLAITGQGIIDGGGDRGDWWSWPKETRNGARRPRTVQIAYSDGVSLSGVTVRNSPSWTVHPYCCRDLTAAAIKIQNPSDSPNTDGLNPESCQGVDIVGVAFSVGDDCIAIKAGKRGPAQDAHLRACRKIAISHCLMERGHGAVVLGSEMSGDIRDVTVENCEFVKTDRGVRLKTRRGRGGVIDGLSVRNVTMRGVETPFAANAFDVCDPDGKDAWVQSREPAVTLSITTPRITRIAIDNVTAEGVTLSAVALLGLPEAPITDVSIENFSVSYDPNAIADVPLMTCGMDPVRHAGVIAEFAQIKGDITTLAEKKEVQ
jgi:polygalacturonase